SLARRRAVPAMTFMPQLVMHNKFNSSLVHSLFWGPIFQLRWPLIGATAAACARPYPVNISSSWLPSPVFRPHQRIDTALHSNCAERRFNMVQVIALAPHQNNQAIDK
ncbi:hypothetical protein, partial [uncultured Ferrimonas sp.]|uniref:hypothetical protein n=1 Tax=uncultured Ferrimonas sp. TaxID=432640 RepID=UPI00262280CF